MGEGRGIGSYLSHGYHGQPDGRMAFFFGYERRGGESIPSFLAPTASLRQFAAAPLIKSNNAKSGNTKPKIDEDAEKLPAVPAQRVNHAITARMLRLVSDSGHEVVTRSEALRRAFVAKLDLVEVNGKADPPVCRLLDFTRFRFDQRKKEKDQRKKQLEKRRRDDVKDVRISSRTERYDMELKVQMAIRHLQRGHRVKCSVMFRSGDKEKGLGMDLMNAMVAKLKEVAIMDIPPKNEDHRIWSLFRAKPGKFLQAASKNVDVKYGHENDDDIKEDHEDECDVCGETDDVGAEILGISEKHEDLAAEGQQ